MHNDLVATHLENLDRRLANVEQVLPTLATKDELAAAIAPLATKAELATAIAPLATKEDVGELRRHMDTLNESQRADTQLIAEHLSFVMSKIMDK